MRDDGTTQNEFGNIALTDGFEGWNGQTIDSDEPEDTQMRDLSAQVLDEVDYDRWTKNTDYYTP